MLCVNPSYMFNFFGVGEYVDNKILLLFYVIRLLLSA